MLDQRFFLDANEIIFISFFFLLLSIILFIFKKLVFTKKDLGEIIISCFILNLLSFLFQNKRFAGESVMHSYGWPHEVYAEFISFDKTQSTNLFTLHYLFANIIFYLSFAFFAYALIKNGKR